MASSKSERQEKGLLNALETTALRRCTVYFIRELNARPKYRETISYVLFKDFLFDRVIPLKQSVSDFSDS